jgi:deoxycytidine triphosphate deaminase
MLISPNTAINNGWITWTDDVEDITKYIQPNAIDFDCVRIGSLNTSEPAFLSENSKVMRGQLPLPTTNSEYGEVWHLKNGECYDFTSNFYVELPRGVAIELIIRSTLNRNGVFLTSGIFDSGFTGHIAGMLRVEGGDFLLAPNTRIGQAKFIQCEDSGVLYSGDYNHSKNTHWSST